MTKAAKTFTASPRPATPGKPKRSAKPTPARKPTARAPDPMAKTEKTDPPVSNTANHKTSQKAPSSKSQNSQIVRVGSTISTMLNALMELPAKTGMNWKQIAERCGFPNANALYNLRAGYCRTLSVQSYLRLSHGLDIPVDELLGNPPKSSVSRPHTLITVRAKAQAGLLQPSPDLPFTDHYQLSLPISPLDAAAGAYGVECRRPGNIKDEDHDTILVAVPLRSAKRRLEAGNLVLLHRTHDDRVEVMSARIVATAKGLAVRQHVGPGPDDTVLHGIKSDARFLSTKARELSLEAIIVGTWQTEP